jgi:hypothetical protein
VRGKEGSVPIVPGAVGDRVRPVNLVAANIQDQDIADRQTLGIELIEHGFEHGTVERRCRQHLGDDPLDADKHSVDLEQ